MTPLSAVGALCFDRLRKQRHRQGQYRLAANQTCEQRISEVVSSTRVKSAALAREHEAQVSELKSAVTRLQAEKRVLEASLESSISEVDRTRLAAGSKQADPGRTGSSLYDNLLSIDLLKKKFQEEVEFWKGETERLQRKLHEADVVQRKLINDTFQDLHSTSKTEFEVAGTQTCGENEELRASIAVLREKLLMAGNENVTLKQKLNDCQKKEMELVKKLSLKEDEVSSLKALLKMSEIQVLQEKDNLEAQLKECAEHHEQTMVGYHLDVEREAGAAVSAALAHHQDKTRRLLADLGRRYEVLIARTREHSRTQINEYKKEGRISGLIRLPGIRGHNSSAYIPTSVNMDHSV
ncbi:hypothetical protein GWK47_036572 [Chionoecetes opilio]|uniref:Uncharacterized protein n=1 Tax=Chionoecetes opilio TaxID=41210 RepID=A0A8J4YT49_CHIOP|nr:hypothetical protein GWK47_036572 [Chionoecetes opilio]